MEPLEFVTLGNVDDGKSTFIGRLLFDNHAVFTDILEEVKRSSQKYTQTELDFSMLTDGLRSEREQGITIDVAYRFFRSPKRKFIIIDAPGHVSYTRNAITGISHAGLAVLIVDATKGSTEQTKRHALLAKILKVPIVAIINKMDLVNYSEEQFNKLREQIHFDLGDNEIPVLPISALEGENVVTKSQKMAWYSGTTVMEFLETFVHKTTNSSHLRVSIQGVLRGTVSGNIQRLYMGFIYNGKLAVGDSVKVCPSGEIVKIKALPRLSGDANSATRFEDVILQLDGEHDIGRGDLIVSVDEPVSSVEKFEAIVFWLSPQPAKQHDKYTLKILASDHNCAIDSIHSRTDLQTMQEVNTTSFGLNDIGRVTIRLGQGAYFDNFAVGSRTGAGILIDRVSNQTVAAVLVADHAI